MAEVIENPISNSLDRDPTRHFEFDEAGMTSRVVKGRRPSSYSISIDQPKNERGCGQIVPSGEGGGGHASCPETAA